jgi:hypothetical protein
MAELYNEGMRDLMKKGLRPNLHVTSGRGRKRVKRRNYRPGESGAKGIQVIDFILRLAQGENRIPPQVAFLTEDPSHESRFLRQASEINKPQKLPNKTKISSFAKKKTCP